MAFSLVHALMISDFLVGVRLAVRAKYFWLTSFSLLILTLAVVLSAQFSGRQPATVSLDVGVSVIRLLLPLVLVLQIQELVFREFDRRYFLGALTYPRSRMNFLFGRAVSIVFLMSVFLLAMSVLLLFLVGEVGDGYAQSTPVDLGGYYWVVILGVFVDALVLISFGFLLSVLASTSSFVLVGFLGFMFVSRSFFGVLELLARDPTLVSDASAYGFGVGMLAYVLPDLGALDVRMIALYGALRFLPQDWLWSLISCLGYALGIFGVAVLVLQRKRLS